MQKSIYLILIFMAIGIAGYGQKAMPVKESAEKGLSITTLDKTYTDALNTNPDSALFKEKSSKFMQSWQSLLQDLGSYLQEHDFVWENQTRCFNKVYFDKDGTIDYFLYNLNPKLDENKGEKFRKLLETFIKDYQLPVQANKKFTQCGSSLYMPSNENSDD